jgi:hypothetical protein
MCCRVILAALGIGVILVTTVFAEQCSPHYRKMIEFGSIPLVCDDERTVCSV